MQTKIFARLAGIGRARFVGTMPDKTKFISKSGTYPQGFSLNGIASGVKANGKKDLAILFSSRPCNAAAVFTKNAFQAAPVQVSRQTLNGCGGKDIHCVVFNSGCANAVTGEGGLMDAQLITAEADNLTRPHWTSWTENSEEFPSSLVMSTGVIGQRLKLDKIQSGLEHAVEDLGSTHEYWMRAAEAICTTDTFPKLVSRELSIAGKVYRIAGFAKGAGMINPNLATLLGLFVTDAPISVDAVRSILRHAINNSFNSISIDGDTSTNDTIAFLANGAAGGSEITKSSPAYKEIRDAVTDIAQQLAKLVVRDGEGATKFVTVQVRGARSEKDAALVASTISNSALVKTAFFGEDANWGRILCAVGYSGAAVNPPATTVSFIPADGTEPLKLLVNGEPQNVDETRASEILSQDELTVDVDLGCGPYAKTNWTCDFSYDYVRINADYRS
ncbi:acetyl-CoA:L-glutamate N-acetyltransferase [Schizosaccharomyces pombe]|uniref:Arginine biosynthesis bifunctional protein ArgJ, mitochondrial n=1 Tax=Schizosaccharomyces pombe (strain 972 / ATCC 24843) TaxID=284812 RepID=ARGJ_SCHPO|nr:putative glutamate N-acetyltransferase [Schizosaccharomyces pombe]O94346.1 RecName: Full=Arginine biosynthesis bifunctional protein ArgJ, mitochondrial; Includes: RecName: Full=Glutamate N-acetyltransferase; Short=GAT; AltName: Full=Ornithine acetyltransferase; Short=OATase; AltName: Full=Ornithine transacetylase; Includes: RecName: Full=Amino-acid acetyltransferase; AltName: Full=N-acetylglutamate synthase; Short=AGS; Contains: RecName: Full=Arginine biosynthesis bifunctional protein ArgJ alph|eukprot:NP_595136.1 putative glutamate N-acetyltransferase [Schizosaccharomyces pombe]